jgi:hypothetical protein
MDPRKLARAAPRKILGGASDRPAPTSIAIRSAAACFSQVGFDFPKSSGIYKVWEV